MRTVLDELWRLLLMTAHEMPYWSTPPTRQELPGRIEKMREYHKAQMQAGHSLGRHQDNGGVAHVQKVFKVNLPKRYLSERK